MLGAVFVVASIGALVGLGVVLGAYWSVLTDVASNRHRQRKKR